MVLQSFVRHLFSKNAQLLRVEVRSPDVHGGVADFRRREKATRHITPNVSVHLVQSLLEFIGGHGAERSSAALLRVNWISSRHRGNHASGRDREAKPLTPAKVRRRMNFRGEALAARRAQRYSWTMSRAYEEVLDFLAAGLRRAGT